MNTIQKRIFSILGTAALVGSFSMPAFANESTGVEVNANAETHLTVKPEHRQVSLEEAKAKTLARIDKQINHLKEVLEKIRSNPNLNEEQKARVANGITKILEQLENLKARVESATSPRELKKSRHDLHRGVRHLKRDMHKKMRHHRVEAGLETEVETVEE